MSRAARLRSHPQNLIRVMPAKGGTIEDRAPSWGITPVPERLRTLGGLENGMLWSSLGLSLLVLVAGAFLVPGLSLPEALLAILVGALFGNALLGFAAAIGAEAGVPAMVLLRAPLGRKGSYLPTGLNVIQNLGWTVFEVLVIATAAHALVHGPLWLWKLLAAAAATILALLGPVGFVREWVKRVALWVVLASLAYLTWWTLHGVDLGALWSQPGKGGLSFWQGVDLWSRCRSRGCHLPLTTRAFRGAAAARSGEPRSATSSRTSGSTRSARSCCSHAGSRTRPP